MANLHCQRQTRIRIRLGFKTQTLYFSEHVHIGQTQTRIPTPYFCVGQEPESRVPTRVGVPTQ